MLIDSGASWDEPLWRELGEMGFLGANIPDAFGGLEALTQSLGAYVSNYYTGTEQRAATARAASRALVPTANAPRRPVEGIEVTGVARLEHALAAAF